MGSGVEGSEVGKGWEVGVEGWEVVEEVMGESGGNRDGKWG